MSGWPPTRADLIKINAKNAEIMDDLLRERDALRDACETTVREMERYYRDGSHPDLSIVLRESKKALAR